MKNKHGQKTAIIIGAGPAGLTAAYELLKKTDIKPVIFEATADIGGISKTVNYKGNRIDIGGHRFFSKSDRVMSWWQDILPLQGAPAKDDLILKRDVLLSNSPSAPDPQTDDKVFLIRRRLSRIFFLKKFFDYPVSLNINTFLNLGIVRVAKIAFSYIKARLFPIKEELSLEDFFINRFGKELYQTFFKDYTEKVWGVACSKISPKWGAQRVKGLSVTRAVLHALRSTKKNSSFSQRDTETSLIERFMYPKFGPGQLWEEVARRIKEAGGNIYLNQKVVGLSCKDNGIASVKVKDMLTGSTKTYSGDYFFSTMPVKDLIASLSAVPEEVRKIAEGLLYRDFMTAGLLLKKLKVKNNTKIKTIGELIPDNWIYIQEKDVKIGRLQIFNNWSPYMVADEDTVWVGLEYFVNEEDGLWQMKDEDFASFAAGELANIGIIDKEDVLDSTVIRMPKAYPAYFGSYAEFDKVRTFTDKLENLFLIGRNGMHRYNNTDHSMLTAMIAVENIMEGKKSKENIWAINAEEHVMGK